MPQPAQTRLDAADEDGNVLVGLADEVAVDRGGVVRALAHDAAGGEGVGFPVVLGDGIVVDHGVHIAAGDQKAQPGTAENVDGFGIFPIRLRDDAHIVAVAFQNPADNGMAEGRMIDVSVADDVHKVAGVPPAVKHFPSGNGQKFHILPPSSPFSTV